MSIDQVWEELVDSRKKVKDLQAEVKRLRDGAIAQEHEIAQILGKALGYPWYKDDQKNFPGATEAHGVCVGEHVALSLADEAAARIAKLTQINQALTKEAESQRTNGEKKNCPRTPPQLVRFEIEVDPDDIQRILVFLPSAFIKQFHGDLLCCVLGEPLYQYWGFGTERDEKFRYGILDVERVEDIPERLHKIWKEITAALAAIQK